MLDFNNRFRELNADGMCSYVLEHPEEYYVTAFKAMKNDASGNFLPCSIVKHNGKPKFVYFTENMYSLEEFIAKNSARDIADAVYSLSRAISQVSENGFLSIACVDTRLSRVFWDKENRKIKLIYLPMKSSSDSNQKRECETLLCQELSDLLVNKSGEPEIQRIRQNLQTGSIKSIYVCDTEDAVDSFAGTSSEPVKRDMVTCEGNDCVVRMLINNIAYFNINQQTFVIGKSAQRVDGVLDNPAVSRQHCKIDIKNDKEVFITDLGSSNGTFIDGNRIFPNEPARIYDGTRVKIANQEFMVEIV